MTENRSFIRPSNMMMTTTFPSRSRVGGEIGTATVCSLVAEQSDGSSKWLSTGGANVTLCWWWAADRECLAYSSLVLSSSQTIFFIVNGSLCDTTTPFWTVGSCPPMCPDQSGICDWKSLNNQLHIKNYTNHLHYGIIFPISWYTMKLASLFLHSS